MVFLIVFVYNFFPVIPLTISAKDTLKGYDYVLKIGGCILVTLCSVFSILYVSAVPTSDFQFFSLKLHGFGAFIFFMNSIFVL